MAHDAVSTAEKLAPSHWSKADISAWAEMCASRLGYQPAGDLVQIVHELGGKVEKVDAFEAEDTAEASIVIGEAGAFTVFLPELFGSARNQFTLAHELGHYLVHYLPHREALAGRRWRAHRSGSDRLEWEANWFAASFLMPEQAFTESYSANRKDIMRTSLDFGVSAMAAEIRAKVLGLD